MKDVRENQGKYGRKTKPAKSHDTECSRPLPAVIRVENKAELLMACDNAGIWDGLTPEVQASGTGPQIAVALCRCRCLFSLGGGFPRSSGSPGVDKSIERVDDAA